jgi:hypothetical protein
MRRSRSTRVHLLPLFCVYLLVDVRGQELSRSGGRAVRYLAGHGGAVEQGRHTGDARDTAVVSSVPRL